MTPDLPAAAGVYLTVLREQGLLLERQGDKLKAPPASTPAERELIRLLKPELLRLLDEEGVSDPRVERQGFSEAR